jgi:hypothetical protein
MVMTGKHTGVLPRPGRDQVSARPRSPVILPAMIAAEGAVIATNEPPGPLGSATPARYGLAYHDVALRAARWFQAASPATVRVWVVPHSGHTQGLATAPRTWEAHVISFLNVTLHPSTSTAGHVLTVST